MKGGRGVARAASHGALKEDTELHRRTHKIETIIVIVYATTVI